LAARNAARGDRPGQTERRRRVRLRRPGLRCAFRGDGNPVAAGRIAFKVSADQKAHVVIGGAARTIREVEKYDPSVGGTIQYVFFTGAPNTLPMVRGTFSG